MPRMSGPRDSQSIVAAGLGPVDWVPVGGDEHADAEPDVVGGAGEEGQGAHRVEERLFGGTMKTFDQL